MHRNRITVLAALVLGVVFLFGQPAITAAAKGRAAKAARVSNALGLTADQKTKIKAIRADAKTQVAGVNADQALTADAKKAKIKAIRQASIAKVKQVLTPEQQSKIGKGARATKANRAGKIGKALGLTADQKAKIKAIRAAARAQILQVLTPEQRAKMEAARGRKSKKV